MSENTKIQWAGDSWNPVTGCKRVSRGCRNCYAIAMTHRLSAMNVAKYMGLTEYCDKRLDWTGEVCCHEQALTWPMSKRSGRRIFVCSMSDLFHEDVPTEFISRVWDVMEACPQHTFNVLTKRARRLACWCRFRSGPPLPNVWVGVSVEDQRAADNRLQWLEYCEPAVRFVSCEPLLDAVCLEESLRWLDWVIVGGESGPAARSAGPIPIHYLIDQCDAAKVPIFVKQLGTNRAGWPALDDTSYKGDNFDKWPEKLRRREFPPLRCKQE